MQGNFKTARGNKTRHIRRTCAALCGKSTKRRNSSRYRRGGEMNILFLSTWYPHRKDAMTGLFVRKHAAAVARYANVTVLYVKGYADVQKFEVVEQEYLFETVKQEKIHEIYIYYPRGKNKIQKIINYIRAYIKGFKTLNFTPDIIHANILTRTVVIAYLYTFCKKKPYVITEHWSRYLPENNSYSGFIRKMITFFVARRAAAILPVSEALKNAMKNNGIINKNYEVVHNVVDDFFFAQPAASILDELSTTHPSSQPPKIILHISCFDDKSKNVSGILQATKILLQKRNDFKLVLIGSGVDFEKTKLFSEQLLLQNSVVFLGEKTPNDVCEWLKKCAFTVIFSNFETDAVVISESLAAGKPIIATNVGGIPEKINKQNGIIVSAENEKELADAMNEMLDNFEKYSSKNISEQAYKNYSFEYVGKQIYQIYKKHIRQP
jgi:glycosyltransferase involved in cell wall biosynthesis